MTGTEGSGQEVQLPEAEYVLPLRWFSDEGLEELTGYLRMLSGWIRITVVDGSAPGLYEVHAAAWAGLAEHRRPESWPGRNGKVAGVMTGVRHSSKKYLVLADDDVRYTLPALRRLVELLAEADVVRPQNYFLTLPWHARWDTARTLLNRAVASDFPGTLGVRRSALEATDGYDGDVLFENLELIRTVKAAGGRELRADDLFVGRIPATAAHFRGQRVRQAYDDFAQPIRLAVDLSLLPLTIFAARRPSRWIPLLAAAVAIAEAGRRRKNGRAVFPPTSALWAPCWLLERAVCIWLAVGQRLGGGVKYAGNRMPTAGTPRYQLRRKYAAQRLQHSSSPLSPRDQERNIPCSQPSRSSQPSQPATKQTPMKAPARQEAPAAPHSELPSRTMSS
ncbi:glycosyltransferase [Arthrobacter sp. VKM Ac-2550]|uniref:glycosyltransferase n=1 Tax=Crystallibacter permensis TaxID=1938888 RepID=UPI00222785ED|nr:glycosyltransferase family 2 protein [Arthrobacter sp. VKM Ac-2550]MCW2134896.1 Glycosyl transferase family 2 [Arthrobacter sp. VKM Ac-2550]